MIAFLLRFDGSVPPGELPQLWHVIRGEMALIGPRPLTEPAIRTHYGRDAEDMLRVKPGIAGPWATVGRNRLT